MARSLNSSINRTDTQLSPLRARNNQVPQGFPATLNALNALTGMENLQISRFLVKLTYILSGTNERSTYRLCFANCRKSQYQAPKFPTFHWDRNGNLKGVFCGYCGDRFSMAGRVGRAGAVGIAGTVGIAGIAGGFNR